MKFVLKKTSNEFSSLAAWSHQYDKNSISSTPCFKPEFVCQTININMKSLHSYYFLFYFACTTSKIKLVFITSIPNASSICNCHEF